MDSSSSKPPEGPIDETLGNVGSGWEDAMADIFESGSGASAPSAAAAAAALPSPMEEGEAATTTATATATPEEEGDLLDDIFCTGASPTAVAAVETNTTFDFFDDQPPALSPSLAPLSPTPTAVAAVETTTTFDFFDDQPPALSPNLAPLSPAQFSIFDQEPDLQLSPTSFEAPVLSSTDLNSAPQPPPEMELSEDPWAPLVSESTESEAPMDEAIDILSSQPPSLRKETPVEESIPLVPEPVVSFPVEQTAPMESKPLAPEPVAHVPVEKTVPIESKSLVPESAAPIRVEKIKEPVMSAPMAMESKPVVPEPVAPVPIDKTKEPVIVAIAPSESPAIIKSVTTPLDEKVEPKSSIDGDEQPKPSVIDVDAVPSDEVPETTPFDIMESAPYIEPEKAPSMDEATANDDDEKEDKFDMDDNHNHAPHIPSDAHSKLSVRSDGDLSDYVTQFTQDKPNMDDLDDILGPMKDDDPSLLERLDNSASTTPKSPSNDKSVDVLYTILSEESSKPDYEKKVLLEEASLTEVEGSTAPKTVEPFVPVTTTPGPPLAEMQQTKQPPPVPMPSSPAPAAAPPAPPVEEQPPGEKPLNRIVASLDNFVPMMGTGLPQPVLTPAVVTQKPPPIYPAPSSSTVGDASFRTSPSGTAVSVLSGSGSFWSAGPLSKSIFSEGMPDNDNQAATRMAARKQAPAPISTLTNQEESFDNEPMQGGRLWEAAQLEATIIEARPTSPEASRFAESIMARTRSRADPNAVVSNSASLDRADVERPTMIRIGENDDTFILNTALARKRVRVVQLLLVGLVGLLVAFLGGIYVQSSCHFVSAQVEVGQNGKVFALHYGLWKYTPMDSVFQGYSYCYQYDDKYTNDAPMFPRWASCIALVGGAFSLSILWFYLIFGRAAQRVWRVAVLTAGLSGILQLCTLIFFIGDVCQRDVCTLGPAGILSVVASCVWFILAFEMHYNTPMTAWVADLPTSQSNLTEPGTLVSNLEMTDFEDGAKAYVRRLVKGGAANPYEYPTLNQIQRDNDNPMGEAMFDRDLLTPRGTYKPPQQLV